MDGEVVMEYTKPTIDGGAVQGHLPEMKVDGTPLTEGFIAIQAESHSTYFKTIELLNLCGCMDKKAMNYKEYFVKANNKLCKYE